MKKYMFIFRIRFINSLQYRTVVLGGVLKGFVLGFMEILMYKALYESSGSVFSMSFSQMVSYVWIQQVFMVLFMVVFADGEIYSSIAEGTIAYDLVRPVGLYGWWFSQSAANRLAFTILNCIPVFLLALLVPEPYRISWNLTVGQSIIFILSVLLAFLVVVSFAMLMYISLFYIIAQRGVRIIVTALTTFLSGGVVPLPFFPDKIRAIAQLLPFAAMQNTPLQIFCGNITGVNMIKAVAFQVFWFVTLFLIGKAAMVVSLKKVIVQGG